MDRKRRDHRGGDPVFGAAFGAEIKRADLGVRPHFVEQTNGDGDEKQPGADRAVLGDQETRQRGVSAAGAQQVDRHCCDHEAEVIRRIADTAEDAEDGLHEQLRLG